MTHLKGVDLTLQRLRKFANDVQKEVIDGMDSVTSKVLTDAKNIVPVRTGRLKESGRRMILRKRVWFTGRIGFYASDPGKAYSYAYYVEFGTRFQSARPYLWPAVTQNREFILERLGRHIDHAIEKNDYEHRMLRKRLI